MTKLALPLLAAGTLSLAVAADAPAGYLGGATLDITGIVPPAPAPGDIRDKADHKVYLAMKRLIGGPRWQAATADVDYRTPAIERDFACATGLPLSPDRFPATSRLLANASADTSRATGAAKERWRHPRPYRADGGETCEDKAELGESYDYPSGHATLGWTFGLVLADVLPGRAGPILARAREYGESRIVCRVHTMSAVETARLGATATMATVRQTPAYLADLAAARAEAAAAHAGAEKPDAVTCAAEERVLAPSVVDGLRK